MVKVMKTANCLEFNPSAVEVSTMVRAVSVIGFNRVQNLALSLMLLDNAENRIFKEESRDVSARALCGALLAEEVTRQAAFGDAEEAFVCTAMRGYGRLLLSTYLGEEYRQALQMSRQMPADRAFRLTFGLTPLEVSERILGEVHIAGQGSAFFQPMPPALLRQKHPTKSEALQLAAEFGSGLADLLSRPELTADDFEKQTDLWLERFQAAFHLDRDTLKSMLERVHDRLDHFGRAQSLVFGSLVIQRIKLAAEGKTIAPVALRATQTSATSAPEQLLPARGPLAAAVKRIKEALAGPDICPNTIYGIAATATRTALRAEGCVIFVRPEGERHYVASAGEGHFFRQIENQALIDPSRRDVFTVCLSQGDDVLIQDPAEARIAAFIPVWFHDLLNGGPFLLLPIKNSAGVFAMICALAPRGQRIELGITRLPQFQSMRRLLSGVSERRAAA